MCWMLCYSCVFFSTFFPNLDAISLVCALVLLFTLLALQSKIWRSDRGDPNRARSRGGAGNSRGSRTTLTLFDFAWFEQSYGFATSDRNSHTIPANSSLQLAVAYKDINARLPGWHFVSFLFQATINMLSRYIAMLVGSRCKSWTRWLRCGSQWQLQIAEPDTWRSTVGEVANSDMKPQFELEYSKQTGYSGKKRTKHSYRTCFCWPAETIEISFWFWIEYICNILQLTASLWTGSTDCAAASGADSGASCRGEIHAIGLTVDNMFHALFFSRLNPFRESRMRK